MTTQKTYLERSQEWIDNSWAEGGITVEGVESAIQGMSKKLATVQVSPDRTPELIADIKATILLLNNTITEIGGQDCKEEVESVALAEPDSVPLVFDSSSLVNYGDVSLVSLTPENKASVLANIRNNPAILKSPSLIKKREKPVSYSEQSLEN